MTDTTAPAGSASVRRIVFCGRDGRWNWTLLGSDGGVLARGGRAGFADEAQAKSSADRVTGGDYRDARKLRRKSSSP